MKKILVGLMALCSISYLPAQEQTSVVNVLPFPNQLIMNEDKGFLLDALRTVYTDKSVQFCAEELIHKVEAYMSIRLNTTSSYRKAGIQLKIDTKKIKNLEGYELTVTDKHVTITGADEAGLFYGVQSFLQLIPMDYQADRRTCVIPSLTIQDAPRFRYRGVMLDLCRHFLPVDFILKQIDLMAMFKINYLHLHLTENQAWRLDIKKYPKLIEKGSVRLEGDNVVNQGYLTQEDVKKIVAYAAKKQIVIVPEFDLPGHSLAAIAAYPHLCCDSTVITPRIAWGQEKVVLCPGKESTFQFIDDVIAEMVEIFPSEYYHIGGDECPKTKWEICPDCQQRIKEEHLKDDQNFSSEEYLQSYMIGRVEKILAKYGKKLIGWDEILEGGLSPNATVMSWRGEKGGIKAAGMNHHVIMSPNSAGCYINHFQGDPFIEPVTNGGYATLEHLYSYDPVSPKIAKAKKDSFVIGVQANLWSEYVYTLGKAEYQMYPRLLALAEIGWSNPARKDFTSFSKRVDENSRRLDLYDVNYHIPLPEQPGGSCDYIQFVDEVHAAFKTTRPVKMVYSLDGIDPTPESAVYEQPFHFTQSQVLKIASVLPSGKMSKIRTITYEKKGYAPAMECEALLPGLQTKKYSGVFQNAAQIRALKMKPIFGSLSKWNELVGPKREDCTRNMNQYAMVAEGYMQIPSDGVYYFKSENDEVWIDGKKIIDNENEVKRYSRTCRAIALAKGFHSIKVVYISNIIGGWPSNWSSGDLLYRKDTDKGYKRFPESLLKHQNQNK